MFLYHLLLIMEINMLIILQDKEFRYVYMKLLVSSDFLFFDSAVLCRKYD
jgi:hypothetical protein